MNDVPFIARQGQPRPTADCEPQHQGAPALGLDRRWRDLLALFLLASFWAATHPYAGIVHDARLYLVQALHGLNPDLYRDDLYFQYGSQDSFSAFSLAYRPLIAALGPTNAHLAAAIFGQAAWLAGLLHLLRALYPEKRRFLFAALAAIGMQSGYGGLNIFHYGEVFVSPRLFAEALVLLSLGRALRTRWVGCALSLLAAFALHPLMALAGSGVLFVLAAQHDRRAWLLVGVGAAALLGLALAQIGPFGRLLLRYDPQWWATVYDRCRFGIIGRWHAEDFLRTASTFAVLATAMTIAEARERRLLVAVAVTAGVATLGSYMGADLAHDLLLTNLQTWRALWLATLLANACVGALVARRTPGSAAHELFLAGALVSAVAEIILVPVQFIAVILLTACAAAHLEWKSGQQVGGFARHILRIPVCGVIAWIAFACVIHFSSDFAASTAIRLAAELAAITGLLLLPHMRRGRSVVALVAVALGLTPLLLFDQREAWTRYVERETSDTELDRFVADAGNLYWERGAELLWIKLHASSYYSCFQGPGSMFYRGTAVEWSRRRGGLAKLNAGDLGDYLCSSKSPRVASLSPTADLHATCKALPDLDTIVLPRSVPGLPTETWTPSTPQPAVNQDGHASYIRRYFKYRCAAFR